MTDPIYLDAVNLIAAAVAEEFGISLFMLHSKRKQRLYSQPRHVAMLLATELLSGASLPVIGGCFRRDHSTVIHGVARIGEALAHDPVLASRVAGLKQRLGAQLAALVPSGPNPKLAGQLARDLGTAIGTAAGREIGKRIADALVALAHDEPGLVIDALMRGERLARPIPPQREAAE